MDISTPLNWFKGSINTNQLIYISFSTMPTYEAMVRNTFAKLDNLTESLSATYFIFKGEGNLTDQFF